MPQILIIHLKRFKKSNNGFSKFNHVIDFPIEGLDLSKFTTDPNLPKNKVKYDLFATVNHFGSLFKGHYVAYIHSSQMKQWVEFDDDELKSIQNTKGFVNDKPYILFYRRRAQ